MTGVPRIQYRPLPLEIIQLPDRVVILYEIHHAFRIIPTDGRGHPDDLEPSYLGDSVGHWEGDTLVVDTVGVKDYALFQNVPHSMNMRIHERIRLIDEDYMENVVTVTDPEYLTEPWTWTWMYKRWPGYKIQEYVCEDNRYYEDPERKYQRLRIDE